MRRGHDKHSVCMKCDLMCFIAHKLSTGSHSGCVKFKTDVSRHRKYSSIHRQHQALALNVFFISADIKQKKNPLGKKGIETYLECRLFLKWHVLYLCELSCIFLMCDTFYYIKTRYVSKGCCVLNQVQTGVVVSS